MGEEISFNKNDTYRAIEEAIKNLTSFESPLIDQRIKAIILTNLEEALLFSLKLIEEGKP